MRIEERYKAIANYISCENKLPIKEFPISSPHPQLPIQRTMMIIGRYKSLARSTML